MTREEIRNLVKANVSRDDKDDLINSLILLGLAELAQRHTFEDLTVSDSEEITVGDYSIPLPATDYMLVEARVIDPTVIDDGYEIVVQDKIEFLSMFPNLTNATAGDPCIGYVENHTLFFGPPSIGDREIHYTMYRVPKTLASDSTEMPIRGCDTALISWVTSSVFMSLEQFDSASFWLQRFQAIDFPSLVAADRRKAAEQTARRGYRSVPTPANASHYRRMSAFYSSNESRW
jgi:hypothetical protein